MSADINDKLIGNRLDRWFVEGLHAVSVGRGGCPYDAETLAEKWWTRGFNQAAGWAERDRLKALNAELVEALEFVEGLYSHEARAAENSMALYEACCMARAALAKHKKDAP